MTASATDTHVITLRTRIRPECKMDFIEWQGRLNELITSFPGFISLEFLTPINDQKDEWVIVQRFRDENSVEHWRQSEGHNKLYLELKNLSPHSIQEEISAASNLKGGVTEVFVTQISPDTVKQYREWLAKIHQVEAKFPGFKGMYVQSPSQDQGKNWITLLQFDTQENLDRWLASPERREVLKDAEPMIASLESHRVVSAYAGWFASIAKEGKLPPAWKQGMIVLLVLFPVVMLEMKYLNPHLKSLNPSLATFIGNSISVALTTWPLIPAAIWFLRWWLVPDSANQTRNTIVGTLFVLGLYALSVIAFWNLI